MPTRQHNQHCVFPTYLWEPGRQQGLVAGLGWAVALLSAAGSKAWAAQYGQKEPYQLREMRLFPEYGIIR